MTLDLTTATEKEFREWNVPWPDSEDELLEIIRALRDRKHDYGTCVYAMSISATATFNYIAGVLGVTGFQASCADMDILSRTRGMKNGFCIVDYSELLFPQYEDKHPGFWGLIVKNAEHLAKEARKMLDGKSYAHPEVRRHWQKLSAISPEVPA